MHRLCSESCGACCLWWGWLQRRFHATCAKHLSRDFRSFKNFWSLWQIGQISCSFLLVQKRTQPTAGTPKKHTRKPSLRLAGIYRPFSGKEVWLSFCTTVASAEVPNCTPGCWCSLGHWISHYCLFFAWSKGGVKKLPLSLCWHSGNAANIFRSYLADICSLLVWHCPDTSDMPQVCRSYTFPMHFPYCSDTFGMLSPYSPHTLLILFPYGNHTEMIRKPYGGHTEMSFFLQFHATSAKEETGQRMVFVVCFVFFAPLCGTKGVYCNRGPTNRS